MSAANKKETTKTQCCADTSTSTQYESLECIRCFSQRISFTCENCKAIYCVDCMKNGLAIICGGCQKLFCPNCETELVIECDECIDTICQKCEPTHKEKCGRSIMQD